MSVFPFGTRRFLLSHLFSAPDCQPHYYALFPPSSCFILLKMSPNLQEHTYNVTLMFSRPYANLIFMSQGRYIVINIVKINMLKTNKYLDW